MNLDEQKPAHSRKRITEADKEHEQWYKDAKEVKAESLHFFINHLINDYEHDYGTICHAIAAAAVAAATAVDNSSPDGGITGFQAGAIMWEFIRHWGVYPANALLQIRNLDDMLYPQSDHKFTTISKYAWGELQKRAKENLEAGKDAHPEVYKHWKSIVNGEIPFGYAVEED
jgi:hypothetical protein